MLDPLGELRRSGGFRRCGGQLSWQVRLVLYSVCVLTLINSAGLVLLLIQHTEMWTHVIEVERQMVDISQSSVVEFMTQVNEDEAEYQYSTTNKRSRQHRGTRPIREHEAGPDEELMRDFQYQQHREREQLFQHKTEEQDGMMMMMTYSMVPVRHSFCY